jgi:hypothetical protein
MRLLSQLSGEGFTEESIRISQVRKSFEVSKFHSLLFEELLL